MFENIRMHFVGIGGIGMSGLAEVYHRLGAKVTGSDLNRSQVTDHLQSLGIKVFYGHSAANLDSNVDVVVFSSAIPPENPEILEARRRRIPTIARAEALAHLMHLRRGIAIAGSHGKTTTTSLMSEVLLKAGLEPLVVVGGRLIGLNSTAVVGKGEWMVAEADESDRSFLHLRPEIAIITNVDNDHLDFYGSFNNLLDAFYDFALRVPFYGFVMFCGDDPWLSRILAQFPKRSFSYGFQPHTDFMVTALDKQGFQLRYRDKILGPYRVSLWGKHNLLNAAAVASVAHLLGISESVVAQALLGFQGVERRMECLATLPSGKPVFSDYAHHPTEIQATLQAFRERFPGQALWVVFQPHRYTRTQSCWDQFVVAFDGVTRLFVADIYPAGETPIPFVTAVDLVKQIKGVHSVEYLPAEEWSKVVTQFESDPHGGILIFMGAGDIHRKARQLIHGAN